MGMEDRKGARRLGAAAGAGLGVGIALGIAIGAFSMYQAPDSARQDESSMSATEATTKEDEAPPVDDMKREPNAEELNMVSIHNLDTSLYRVSVFAVERGDIGQREIDAARKNLKCLRDWIGDRPERQAYMTWWEFYSEQLDEAQAATGKTREIEADRQMRAREKDAIRERDERWAKRLPVPPREAMVCAKGKESK